MSAVIPRRDEAAGPAEPVAVVGAGCRLPGGVATLAGLWRLLEAEREAVIEVPPDRWDTRRLHAELPPNTVDRIRCGGFLTEDITAFDPDFFGISGPEARWLDPQHRLLLEVAWEACEHAGIPVEALRGTTTGVFTGMYVPDHLVRSHRTPQETGPYWMTGAMHGVGAGRLSFLMDLHGPSLAVDTACSSSLVALHLACQSLRARECDAALAAGASVVLSPEAMISEARWDMFSPTGHCHSFDAAADGYVRSEGCGVVLLKRLQDAARDGDRILAVVRGSAVNQDGRSVRLTAPSQQAQQQVGEAALARSGVEPEQVGMVEAHGAGTAVGDPIEFAALNAVYGAGPGRCALGSLKSNIGHTEPASGIAGLLKTIVCLQHGRIPATLHFQRWNPQIDADGSRLFVPTRCQSWPVETGPRLAAVTSYGVGGTNAHVIVEQAPAPASAPVTGPAVSSRKAAARAHGEEPAAVAQPTFLLSGGSGAALRAAAGRLAKWLEDEGARVPLRDVAHTLAVRRSHAKQRLGVVAGDRSTLVERLRAHAAGQPSTGLAAGPAGDVGAGAVFVYSGHGSQWAGMGQRLLAHSAPFAAAVDELEPLLLAEGGFSLREVLAAPEVVSGVDRVQPVIFAYQIALTALWQAHGVQPAAVVGHSMGEVAAAVVAGGLSLADGVRVICRRARLLKRTAGRGAMASVQLGAAEVDGELRRAGADAVSVAVMAAPHNTVVSGDAGQVGELLRMWEERGVGAARVRVDVASHSAQMDPILDDLRTALREVTPRTPKLRFYSTVLDDPRADATFDAAYWCANQRRPVLFSSAITAAAGDDHGLFLEVNAHPLLTRAVEATLADAGKSHARAVPAQQRDEDECLTFATRLATAHCAGFPVPWQRLLEAGQLAEVPPTTFERRPHRVEPSTLTQGSAEQPHPLLGEHVADPQDDGRHLWQGAVGIGRMPWLADHRLEGLAVLPAACYCEMALAAADTVFPRPPGRAEVRDIDFQLLLPVEEHDTPVTMTCEPADEHRAGWQMRSRPADEPWQRHSTAHLTCDTPAPPEPADLAGLRARYRRPADLAQLRDHWHTAHGLQYGPGCQSLTALNLPQQGTAGALAEVTVPDAARPGAASYRWHPVLLDAGLQAMLALWHHATDVDDGHTFPRGIGRLRTYADTTQARWCHVRLATARAREATGSFQLLDESGAVLAEAEDVRFAHGAPPPAQERFTAPLLQQRWEPLPLAADTKTGGSWLLVTGDDADPQAAAFAHALETRGATVHRLASAPPAPAPHRLFGTFLSQADGDLDGIIMWLPSPRPVPDALGAEHALQHVLHVVQSLQALAEHAEDARPRLTVITRTAQWVRPDDRPHLDQAGVRGLLRVLTYEHPELQPTLIDTDGATTAANLAAEVLAGPEERADEVAWRGPTRYLARLTHAPLEAHERRHTACRFETHTLTVRCRQAHDVSTAELVRGVRRSPGPGQVQIRVQATGAAALAPAGKQPGPDAVECAGTVSAVGPDVHTVRTGQQVIAVLEPAEMSNYALTRADWVLPLPDGTRPAEAAGLPLPCLTAWYGLRHLARLQPHEPVLIHEAGHGAGLAAVHIARARKATVWATAATAAQRRYLHGLGVCCLPSPGTHAFADAARHAAGTAGFPVVFTASALTAPQLRACLDALAASGRLVAAVPPAGAEAMRLAWTAFGKGITVSTFDARQLLTGAPETVTGLLAEVGPALARGDLPAWPCTVYPVTDAATALRVAPDGRHTGSLALAWPGTGPVTAVTPPPEVPVVRADASYVITGGLGGLGMLVCRWLAGHGAGTIVVNSRSAPSAETAEALDELRCAGTRIEVVRGDIAAPGTAENLVHAAEAGGMPLRGVVHAAMDLKDATATGIDAQLLEKVWRPKAHGAWRLHEATGARELDWWVLFSSFTSTVGSPGQGAYAAANAWMDEFASWRRAQNLPVTAINWGPWAEVGRGAQTRARGFDMITPAEGIAALEHLLRHDRHRTAYIALHPHDWLAAYPATAASSFFQRLITAQHATEAPGDLLADLTGAEGPQRQERLRDHIIGELADVLSRDAERIDPDASLVSLGLDSLLTIELRNRLQRTLRCDIPRTALWTKPTLTALAEDLLDRLALPQKG
ncbi:type I polyketide synthase [Streptomyces rimosus]|uniref:type I polyketide synthase n=1 Tax=Streptomyces rimosus TaxID=1927 RepID=UPI0009982875|nr:type I polyketide synthase [Streptomyces rimosus]